DPVGGVSGKCVVHRRRRIPTRNRLGIGDAARNGAGNRRGVRAAVESARRRGVPASLGAGAATSADSCVDRCGARRVGDGAGGDSRGGSTGRSTTTGGDVHLRRRSEAGAVAWGRVTGGARLSASRSFHRSPG